MQALLVRHTTSLLALLLLEFLDFVFADLWAPLGSLLLLVGLALPATVLQPLLVRAESQIRQHAFEEIQVTFLCLPVRLLRTKVAVLAVEFSEHQNQAWAEKIKCTRKDALEKLPHAAEILVIPSPLQLLLELVT